MTTLWTPPLLSLEPDTASGWNSVISFTGEPIPLGPAGEELTFRPTSAPAADALVAPVRASGLARPVLVHFRAFPFADLCSADLTPSDLELLPSGLRDALYEGMVAHVWNLLAPDAVWSPSVGDTAPLEACAGRPAPDDQWLELAVGREGNRPFRLVVGISMGDLLRVLKLKPFTGPGAAGVPFSAVISAAADFTIGTLIVTYGQLASVGPGSIVVMARQDAGTCLVRVGETLCTLVATDEGWCCASLEPLPQVTSGGGRFWSHHGQTMPDDRDKTGRRASLQELRCTLTFEIGRRSITLAELAHWREGALVELDPPELADGMEVTIRANGDVIGSGDLVRIDDRIAVRVTWLAL